MNLQTENREGADPRQRAADAAWRVLSALLGRITAHNPFRHRHRWEGSGWNGWCIEIEQKCRCGDYRHHLFEDRRGWDEPAWREGRHPGVKA